MAKALSIYVGREAAARIGDAGWSPELFSLLLEGGFEVAVAEEAEFDLWMFLGHGGKGVEQPIQMMPWDKPADEGDDNVFGCVSQFVSDVFGWLVRNEFLWMNGVGQDEGFVRLNAGVCDASLQMG